MPPKKKDVKAEKGMQRAAEKEKQKIVEDKTFGLKNKNKSKAVQKYIKTVQQQVKGPQKGGEQALIAKKKEEQEAKKKEAQQQALLASLFRGTENVKRLAMEGKPGAGTYDPKASKEAQRIDLYTDQRVQRDTMEEWSQAQLEEVIHSKHFQQNEKNSTAIICKYFIDAVEKRQYGWFWSCPNGGDACIYRHCLPPGYVLKADAPAETQDEEEPIEVIVERERALLPAGGTPVTLATFKEWKEKKERERQEAVEAHRMAEAKRAGNRGMHVLSGRDLFQFDPSLFIDDEGAAAEDDYVEEETPDDIATENQKLLDQANQEALRLLQERSEKNQTGGQETRSSEADSSDGDEERNGNEKERKSKEKREDDAAQQKSEKSSSSQTNKSDIAAGVRPIREDLFLYGDDFNELKNVLQCKQQDGENVLRCENECSTAFADRVAERAIHIAAY